MICPLRLAARIAALAFVAAFAEAVPAYADPVLAAAGDIACAPGSITTTSVCRQAGTATEIENAAPTLVAALGDQQYESGLLSEYQGSYDLSWGAFKPDTRPVPGNHEYKASTTAAGYFSYFGGLAGPSSGYYSYDLGAWHVIALNSNCTDSGCAYYPGGGEVSTAEVDWLKADLAAHQGQCTLAYWHHPLFTQSDVGESPDVKSLWDALYAHGADVVLNGHTHVYERYGQLDPTGSAATTHGVREFTSGLGGKATTLWASPAPSPAPDAKDNSHFGVLFLTLHQGSYDWAYRGENGTVYDSNGAGDHTACHEPQVTVNVPQPAYTGEPSSFQAAATVPDGTPIDSYSWDFGDSGTSSEQNPSHTYAAAGDRTVTLVVTDHRGLTTTVTRTVSVSDRPTAGSVVGPPAPTVSPSPAGVPAAPARISPKLLLSAASRGRLSRALRHGLRVRATGNFSGRLLVRVRLVKVSPHGSAVSSLATKTVPLSTVGHSIVLTVRLGNSAHRRLAGASRAVLAIDAVLSDGAGHRATASRKMSLLG